MLIRCLRGIKIRGAVLARICGPMPNADLDALGLTSAPKNPKLSRKKTSKNTNKNGEESEHSLQRRATVMLSRIVSKPGITNQYNTLWYGVDCGSPGSENRRMANKNRGIESGILDKDFYVDGKAFKIELKTKSGDY